MATAKDEGGQHRSFTEEFEIAGSQLLARVKELVAEGNVRRLRVGGTDGGPHIEIPLTAGVVAGGVVTLAAPWLAVLGVLAALVTNAKVEVTRIDGTDKPAKD